MIHSMAGGNLGSFESYDYAKVEILEGINAGKLYWYKTNIFNLKVGDKVLVPIDRDNKRVLARVLRIDKRVNSHAAPVPSKNAKYIICIVK